ncbi:MAG: NAD(P)H-hydrate dehydratase [Candidatus Omnitrophica bacterium]|nr:NAD(P)H-hydrate dehydratase [Candidatus Omnitrophota bacterium]
MLLPTPLLRKNKTAHKNVFGHVLVIAGSPSMLGAGALVSLAAMRSGAGLVTWAVPKSLNLIAQKKASNTVMTLPCAENKTGTFSLQAFMAINKSYEKFNAIAIGPGLTAGRDIAQFIEKIIATSPVPLVIDADALNCLVGKTDILLKTNTAKILTPHPGEMSRLTGFTRAAVEKERVGVAQKFAQQFKCILLLKGHSTVVASPDGQIYFNKTGNAGMAKAGSGDVLTGMIAAFLGQGIEAFEAAKWGAYLHGKAGDIAAKDKGRVALIAMDIIEAIPAALKSVIV